MILIIKKDKAPIYIDDDGVQYKWIRDLHYDYVTDTNVTGVNKFLITHGNETHREFITDGWEKL